MSLFKSDNKKSENEKTKEQLKKEKKRRENERILEEMEEICMYEEEEDE